ncbi:Intraflagellar Transport Protein 20 [Phytophthora nicotianae]|uniref:Intraflagellar Transport Protein 20 n=1 Tax=Phytophthora nicotianae TaxID=4792 RepID=A0A0W8DJJ4_PHYNI|nr:Intraflagellar Transport Protein 20 [Phytophthora nicotianae]
MSAIPRIIDSDSDSDDDVPLSALRAKAPAMKQEVKTEVKVEVKAEAPSVANGAGNGKRQVASDSDSDDDIPISGLAKRKKLKVETKVKTEKARVTTPSSRSTPRKAKKRVIKKLHGVQELDGYPGAFIRVKGDDLGSIIDTRSSVGKPSFLHFFAMSSEDLLKLLLQAYDKQMEVLVEHEGPDVPLLKELQKARASAARINPEKAERGVRKVLKNFAELEREIKEVALKEAEEEEEEDEDDDDDDTADD